MKPITNQLSKQKCNENVRLIIVLLRSGEMELIITSLLDEIKYPSIIFKELYFKHWSIETLYDKLENKLLVENFTDYSEASILQDFYLHTIF